jgi:pimeloyl-ACP methyl ester carboxylesterase
VALAAVVGLALLPVVASAAPASSSTGSRPTIVLEHGAWADSSSWRGVIERLQGRGFKVLAPPNPLRGGQADAAYLVSYLRTVPGPIVLVGHSYGGFVITNAAVSNLAVKALVYMDAFIPDAGENLLQRTGGSCLGGDPTRNFDVVPTPGSVDLFIKSMPDPPFLGLAECFANGLSPAEAAVVAAVQRPIAANALAEPSGPPAWRRIPSWAMVGLEDRVITATEQEFMAKRAGAHIVTVAGGHLALISRPDAATDLILAAVDATS